MTGNEQLVISYMKPGQDYTSVLIGKSVKLPRPVVSKILRDDYRGGCIERSHREGVKGFVYQTKQLSLIH